MEEWKDVVGYEGLYEVSNLGNVRSLNWRNKGITKNLVLNKHNRGYMQVSIGKRGETKTYVVHRLVALAFLDNPNGFTQVNHKDEDKTNNNVENLEWCTASYNVRYSMKHHPQRPHFRKNGIVYKNSKFADKTVLQMTLNGMPLREWENVQTIFRETGMSASSILQCCKGTRHKAYGFKWCFTIEIDCDREAAV